MRTNRRMFLGLVAGLLAGTVSGPMQAQQGPENRPPANVVGTWTIYADNVRQPGSSLKTVVLSQNGSVVTGKFKGPHQSGKVQGWINGNHIEFSTDTRDVLTFRGQINGDMMSGMYGVQGQHAPWHAQRD
jgi:hypothetical protein